MSVEDFKVRSRANKETTCRHFTGLGLGTPNIACDAGVAYKSLPRPMPCFPGHNPDNALMGAAGCALYRAPTEEELAADEAEIEAALERLRGHAERGECFTCGQHVERRVQVGRCVYAEPCGHRLGQGKA